MDWFLYDNGLGHWKVKEVIIPLAKHINQMIITAKCIVVFISFHLIVVSTSPRNTSGRQLLTSTNYNSKNWRDFDKRSYLLAPLFTYNFLFVFNNFVLIKFWVYDIDWWQMLSVLINITEIKWSEDEVGHWDFLKFKMIVIWFCLL